MECDSLTREEAISEIRDMRKRIYNGEDLEEVLNDYGLEIDYFIDLF